MLFKSEKEQFTLLYGLRLFTGKTPDMQSHPHFEVTLSDGRKSNLTLHTITGGREEIRAQLLQSIDAFFELIEATEGEKPLD